MNLPVTPPVSPMLAKLVRQLPEDDGVGPTVPADDLGEHLLGAVVGATLDKITERGGSEQVSHR